MPEKHAAFLTIHGMGRTPRNYDQDIRREIRHRLRSRSRRLHFGRIYYQDILQPNQDRIWKLLAGKLRWDGSREFVLFGFADAAGLEAHKEKPDSPYLRAQLSIAKTLFATRVALGGNKPIVILAQSLGGQVLSNYLWDAQQYLNGSQVSSGIWANLQSHAYTIGASAALDESEIEFLAGYTIRYLYTTGCNIPIFVAAHAVQNIVPIEKPNSNFEWHNYYDKDDVLGWPLKPLSDGYSYLVTDHRINAGQGLVGWFLKSWNPASHNEYWGDDEVLDNLEAHLKRLL